MSEYENIEIRPDGEVRSSQVRVGQITLDKPYSLIGFEGEWHADLYDRITDMEAEISGLESDVSAAESERDDAREEADELREEIESLKTEIADLRAEKVPS